MSEAPVNSDNLIHDIVLGICGVILLGVAIFVLIAIYKLCMKKIPKFLQNLVLKLKSKLMWNSALRYMA